LIESLNPFAPLPLRLDEYSLSKDWKSRRVSFCREVRMSPNCTEANVC
jgi:hypothetical protein